MFDLETIILVSAIIITWALWGFLYKVGLNEMGLWPAYLLGLVVWLVANISFIAAMLIKGVPLTFGTTGSYAIIGGAVASFIGTFLFYVLLNKAPVSIAVPLTAVYPALTAILGILILSEEIKIINALGIVFAIIAAVLLSL